MGGPDDTGTIDFPPDREQNSGREVDAETYVSAAAIAFNSAALPPDMPGWLRDAILADASQIVQAMQDDELRLIDAKQRQDEDQNTLDTMWEAAREQREREWDQSRVTVGGVTLSGEEWDDAYEALSDPKMRAQLVQGMVRKKGWSQERAEKAADDALTLAQIAQRKKDGTITPEDEVKAGEITRRNPDAVEMVKEVARQSNERGLGTDRPDTAPAQSYLSADVVVASTEFQTAMRATAAKMSVADNSAFNSAPDLVARFDAARDAAVAKPAAEPAKPMSPQLIAKFDMNSPF